MSLEQSQNIVLSIDNTNNKTSQTPSENNNQSANSVEQWLTNYLATRLNCKAEDIDKEETFARYGLDSKAAVSFVRELENHLGRKLFPTVVWDYPNINTLTAYLTGQPITTTPTIAKTVTWKSESEPIAIVGMSCRLPGASNLANYWNLLSNGIDAVSEVPADRWNINNLYHPDISKAGKMNTRWGGFISDIDLFDPYFFGISPREAAHIDPQQRLVLELCWQALEDAYILPNSLKSSPTGVFLGAMWSDYMMLMHQHDIVSFATYSATGQDLSLISARVSYTFDFQGPSLVVSTACSSSLVAIHLACQSLRNRESSLALAGGVNLILSPGNTIAMCKLGTQSPDGRCKAFDANANGYVRGEGAGILVLKPLSTALADGNRIYCIIRGSAVNNDGLSNGLTAPNPKAQEKVLRQVYQQTGIDPILVDYVETHGTGTSLGDPIEARAIGNVLGTGRSPDQPCYIGSVKTNIGHLEPAAGVASIIKVALAIKNRQIPATLHFKEPNPYIPFKDLHLAVQDKLTEWPADKHALAGVSSFGFGGTNAHLLLEELPTTPVNLIALSANSDEELISLSSKLKDYCLTHLVNNQQAKLSELGYTSSVKLSHETKRLAFLARDWSEFSDRLEDFLESRPHPELVKTVSNPKEKIVFVFSGQGSQWWGMGRNLLYKEPVFRKKIAECDQILSSLVKWSILETLTMERRYRSDRRKKAPKPVSSDSPRRVSSDRRQTESSSYLNEADVVQPVLFAIQVALAELWKSWGIIPDAVIGHSLGEIAAAHIAGVLSLSDAISVVYHRSRLQKKMVNQGGMAVVHLPVNLATEAIANYASRVCIGASNSPNTTVLSGELDALNELTTNLEEQGVSCNIVKVNIAFHSHQMAPLGQELFESVGHLKPQKESIPIFSTVTGQQLAGQDFDQKYWVRNMVDPVWFAPAIEELIKQDYSVFLEVGPHPVLAAAIEDSSKAFEADTLVLVSNKREEDEYEHLFNSVAQFYTLGKAINWQNIYPDTVNLLELPAEITENHQSPAVTTYQAHLLTISAHNQPTLQTLAKAYLNLLEEKREKLFSLSDFCYTANVHRTAHDYRLAIAGSSTSEFIEKLQAFSDKQTAPAMYSGQKFPGRKLKLAFIFCGQGPQWWAMGRELINQDKLFRSVIEECDKEISQYSDWSLLTELLASEEQSRIFHTEITQPAIFAIQIALAKLWESWGITPSAVIGHSMGEVAAAYIAGALTLAEAIKVIFYRGKIMQQTHGQGNMAVIWKTLEETQALLAEYDNKLSIGAQNSPNHTVVSGDPTALADLLEKLSKQDVFFRKLRVEYAFHSSQMEPLVEPLALTLSDIKPRSSNIPVISTLTGELIDTQNMDAKYWGEHVKCPVMFANAINHLVKDNYNIFIEIAPHPVLADSIQDALKDKTSQAFILPSLRRAEAEKTTLLGSLGALYTAGFSLDWQKFYPYPGHYASLPDYPWQKEHFWITPNTPSNKENFLPAVSNNLHPLVGQQLSLAEQSSLFWQSLVSTQQPSYLADIKFQSISLLPASAYIEIAFSTAKTLDSNFNTLTNLRFENAVFLVENTSVILQTQLSKPVNNKTEFKLFSKPANTNSSWQLNATAEVSNTTTQPNSVNIGDLISLLSDADDLNQSEDTAISDYLHEVENLGFQIGDSFNCIKQIKRKENTLIAQLSLADYLSQESHYQIHPVLLESAFQLLASLIPKNTNNDKSTHLLATSVDNLSLINKAPSSLFAYVIYSENSTKISGDIFLFDISGNLLLEAIGVCFQYIQTNLSALIQSDEALLAEVVESVARKELFAITSAKKRQLYLDNYLKTKVAEVLKISPTLIENNKPLREFGIDSLMTLELRNQLEKGLSLSLSPTLLWNYPTIDTLTPFLATKLELSLTEDSVIPTVANPVITPDVANAANAVNTVNTVNAANTANNNNVPVSNLDVSAIKSTSASVDTDSSDEDLLSLLDQELEAINDLLKGSN